MNDYIMLNLFRQRENEILKELEGIRLLKTQEPGGREQRKEIRGRLKSIMASLKRSICRRAYRTSGMMDPLHLKEPTMQHHPEL
jgi:hypothetical protein